MRMISVCHDQIIQPNGKFHAGLSYTGELKGSRFNVFDVTERMYIRIMEW